MGDFARDVAVTIHEEGGAAYTNFSWDPGGGTKYGISQKAHPSLDIKNLTLTAAEAIYHDEYWNPAGCDRLAEPLALNVFDLAVNAGVGVAKHTLTLPAVVLPRATEDYLWARIKFYTDLVRAHPQKAISLAGWIERCYHIRAASCQQEST